jgi:DNA-binding NtrC family response regulator
MLDSLSDDSYAALQFSPHLARRAYFELISKARWSQAMATPVTVMVVDPDVLVRMTISDFLRDCGYRVIEGVKAEDVWTVIASKIALDVVFAEVQLSAERTGFELAKELRQTQPGIDVILTSGIADAAEKSSDLCEQGPIKKPYHPQQVVDRIHLLLERRRSAQNT